MSSLRPIGVSLFFLWFILWTIVLPSSGFAAGPKVLALKINGGELATLNRKVLLYPTVSGNPSQYQASESTSFKGASWRKLSSRIPFTLTTKKGNHTVYFRVRAGQKVSQTKKASIRIVNGTPITMWSFQINDGEEVTTNRSIKLSSRVDRPVQQYLASEFADFTGSRWLPYKSQVPFQLSSDEGRKKVYYKVRTSVGLESWVSNASIILDETPAPNGILVNGGDSTTATEYISLNIPASGSPREIMVSESPNFAGAYWQPYQSTILWQLSAGGGKKTLFVKLRDERSESAVTTVDLFYDEPPTPYIVAVNNLAPYTESRAVSVTLLAGGEPVEYQLSEDPGFTGAIWSSYVNGGLTTPFLLSDGEGTKRLYARFRDTRSMSAPVSVSIDYDLPIILRSTTVDDGFAEAGARTRFVTVQTDVEGSPTEMRISENGGFLGSAWQPFSNQAFYKLSKGDGVKRIYFQLRDKHHDGGTFEREINLIEQPTTFLTKRIFPNSPPERIDWKGQIAVTVPTLSVAEVGDQGAVLTITSLPSTDADHFNCFRSDSVWDISIEDRHDFSSNFTFEYLYDQASLEPGMPARYQLSAAYYDDRFEGGANWVLEPCSVRESDQKIICHSNHLSQRKPVQNSSGYGVLETEHFRILYNTNISYPSLSSGQEPMSYYVDRVAKHLDDAWAAYAGVTSAAAEPNFRMPEEILIVRIDDFGQDETVLYDGSIQVPITYSYEPELQQGLAHELFHAVQNRYRTRPIMGLRRWFVEATAEFAAGVIAGPISQMGRTISPKFLERALGISTGSSDKHPLESSHFLNFLFQSHSQFKEAFEYVMASPVDTSTDPLDSYLKSKGSLPLGDVFANFATHFLMNDHGLFEKTRPIADYTSEVSSFPENSPPLSRSFSLPSLSSKLWAVNIPTSGAQRPVNVKGTCPLGEIRIYTGVSSDRSSANLIGQLTDTSQEHAFLVPAGKTLYLQSINKSVFNVMVNCQITLSDRTPVIDSVSPLIVEPNGEITLTGQRFGINPSAPGASTSLSVQGDDSSFYSPQILSWSDTQIRFKPTFVSAGVNYEAFVRTSESGAVLESNPGKFSGSIISVLQTMKQFSVELWGLHSIFDTYNNPLGASSWSSVQPHFMVTPYSLLGIPSEVQWSGPSFSVRFGPGVIGTDSYGNGLYLVTYNVTGTVNSLGSRITTLSVSEDWREIRNLCRVYSIFGKYELNASDIAYSGHGTHEVSFSSIGSGAASSVSRLVKREESHVECDSTPPTVYNSINEYRSTNWSSGLPYLSVSFSNY